MRFHPHRGPSQHCVSPPTHRHRRYDVELLYVAKRLGLPIACVPVPWADVDGSKIRWHTPLRMLLDVVRVACLYGLGVWRLRLEDGAAARDVDKASGDTGTTVRKDGGAVVSGGELAVHYSERGVWGGHCEQYVELAS